MIVWIGLTAAAGTASSDGSAKGGPEWPLVAMIPVVVVFWLAALAVYLVDGTAAAVRDTRAASNCPG